MVAFIGAQDLSPGSETRPWFTEGWRKRQFERAGAAAAVLVLHAAAIAIILLSDLAMPVSATPDLIVLSSVNNGTQQPARPHAHHNVAAVPLPAIPVVKVAEIASRSSLPDALPPLASPVPYAPSQAMLATVGGACDLTEPVQDALQHSDEVRRALPGITPDLRSVANAIVVWNAGWIDPATASAQAAFAALRRTITQTVAASSADCRSQLQIGPRLIFLPANASKTQGRFGETTVLALGSGQWSWQQLVDGALPLSSGQLAAALTPIVTPVRSDAADPNRVPPSQATPMSALLASLIHNRSPTGLPYYP